MDQRSAAAHRLSDPRRWADPTQPALTFYDHASGERTELSAITQANWVAKTASFGTDLLGLEPGDSVRLALPTHWLGSVWVLAALTAGWRIVPTDAEPGSAAADVLVLAEATSAGFTSGDSADGAARLRDFREVVAVSTRPLSLRFGATLPSGAFDYAAEVSACADVFAPVGGRGDAARDQHDAWLADAQKSVAGRGLDADTRLLATVNPVTTAGIVDTVLAPALATSSVVLLAGPAGDWADHIGEIERATTR